MINIDQILQELFSVDPALKDRESELRAVIEKMLASKPDTAIDEEFVRGLRQKLLAEADLKQARERSAGSMLRIFGYALGGLAVVVLVVAATNYTKNNQSPKPTLTQHDAVSIFSPKLAVNAVGNQAFGNLTRQDVAITGRGGGQESAPAGLGGTDTFAAPMAKIAPDMAGGGLVSNIRYVYKYAGGDIALNQKQVAVYRRVKNSGSGVSASTLLSQLNFGLLDISKFSNAEVQSMNIVENKEFGYNFYISAQEGTISISENWQTWPNPERNCTNDQCLQNMKLKMSDVPTDSELAGIADQFLHDHNIALESYGKPQVLSDWKRQYEAASNKAESYIPNVVTIIYPLMVDGHQVYDQGGNPYGLSVSVDIRFKKVSGVAELASLNYESSQYPAVTDAKGVIAMAEQGGAVGSFYYGPGNAKEVTVELGQPAQGYVQIYKNDPAGQGQMLLVPALIFPITNKPEGDFYQKNVVVPLVSGMVETPGQDGPIRIMNK